MTSLSFQHLLEADQITKTDIKKLIALAQEYQGQRHDKTFVSKSFCNAKNHALSNRSQILATLFFEPSTRTRFSFESAMIRLGGHVISLEHGESSSVKKGESLCDTGRVVSNYADIIVMRHPRIGSVAEFARYATIPVINAGDGANQHPSQSLADIYTIFCEKKKLNNLKIGIVGDLKYGRSVHSFLNLMSLYSGNSFTLISHPGLALDIKNKNLLKRRKTHIIETSDIETAIPGLDVLYVVRVQQERFASKSEYEKVKNFYRVDKKLLLRAKADLTIMHPLPRINEIAEEVNHMPQAKYFAQANYGLYIRMALLFLMTNEV
jgi:aspartate carbamoyltransferase catalytic subunit